ncbi:hypothetical protein BKA70DRAFT_460301 [Coprinopsis sp. MPI-PUGE-AT-0042]|nr:hypothetical protein BKA70DRAFT_460301 [Coprinopsis sp. MPI-PUGE-AT-0042]
MLGSHRTDEATWYMRGGMISSRLTTAYRRSEARRCLFVLKKTTTIPTFIMQPDHHHTLSTLASAVFKIERQLRSLSSPSNVAVSGGTFNNAGRDICHHYSYHFYPNPLTSPSALHGSHCPEPPAGADVWRATWRKATHQQHLPKHAVIPSKALLSGYLPVKFEGLVIALRLVDQQVQPHAAGILGEVQQTLSNLTDLVVMSSNIYDALGGSELGDRVRSMIDARVTQCTHTLSRAHQQLDGLAYRRLPMLGLVYHHLLRSSWDRWEPMEISSIRTHLNTEAECFAEWLSLLRSFCWARRLFLNPQSRFSWDTLNTFFTARPDMMKDVHVERITVIEPLQGEHLTIPLRFVNSFEDVHIVIHLACQGTRGSRFIEGRRYELDDVETSEAVSEEDFISIKDGRVFEVAILMKSQLVELGGCPKCGTDPDRQGATEGGWVRCGQCRTQFIRHVSKSRTTCIEEVSEGDDSLDAQEPATNDFRPYLFRRMKIEMLLKPQEQLESQTSSTSNIISGGTFNLGNPCLPSSWENWDGKGSGASRSCIWTMDGTLNQFVNHHYPSKTVFASNLGERKVGKHQLLHDIETSLLPSAQ